MDMSIADTTAAQLERRAVFGVLLQPLLQPLQSVFGEYGELATAEFAQALGRIEDTRHA